MLKINSTHSLNKHWTLSSHPSKLRFFFSTQVSKFFQYLHILLALVVLSPITEKGEIVRKMAPFREMASHAMVAIFPHMCFGDLMTTQHLD